MQGPRVRSQNLYCEWLQYRAFKAGRGCSLLVVDTCVSLMRIFMVQWAVFVKGGYQLGRLQADTPRRPGSLMNQQVACTMLRVTSFLHIAFHFRSSLKSEHFLCPERSQRLCRGRALWIGSLRQWNTVYSQTGEDRPCLEMDCLISGIIRLITHIS